MLAHTLLLWLSERSRVVVDTETDGLAWEAAVRLVQFGDSHGGFAISVENEVGRALVRHALTMYRGQLVFHNSAFDIRRLGQIGCDPDYLWPRAINTHTLAHIVEPGEISFKLKDLAVKYLGPEANEAEKAMKALAKAQGLGKEWWKLPLCDLAPYGIKDTVLTSRLYDFYAPQLADSDWAVCARELEAAEAVAQVQWKGFRFDVAGAEKLRARWQEERLADQDWFAQFGIVKPGSSRQVSKVLMEQGWQPEKYTPTGEVTLDRVVLKTLGDYEVARRHIEWKRRDKWTAAYIDGALNAVDSQGRVHAGYNPLGARTGRMSCSKPPLQQLPKGGGGEIRSLFIASEGNLIGSVDYSQIEMRLAGHFSQDPDIIQMYEEGIDVYQEMADFIGCTRPQAKIASLAAVYGSYGKSIAVALNCPVEEAVRIVDAFWQQFPKLGRWCRAVQNAARGGRVPHSQWGRGLRPHLPYAAGNAIIQGTAAEVLKDGLLRLAEANLLQYVVALVHDEVVLDVPEADAVAVTNQVAVVLEDRNFIIPLTAEPEVYGKSWGDGYV